jgi:hypothetical protein
MLNDETERKINKNDKNKTQVNPPNMLCEKFLIMLTHRYAM